MLTFTLKKSSINPISAAAGVLENQDMPPLNPMFDVQI